MIAMVAAIVIFILAIMTFFFASGYPRLRSQSMSASQVGQKVQSNQIEGFKRLKSDPRPDLCSQLPSMDISKMTCTYQQCGYRMHLLASESEIMSKSNSKGITKDGRWVEYQNQKNELDGFALIYATSINELQGAASDLRICHQHHNQNIRLYALIESVDASQLTASGLLTNETNSGYSTSAASSHNYPTSFKQSLSLQCFSEPACRVSVVQQASPGSARIVGQIIAKSVSGSFKQISPDLARRLKLQFSYSKKIYRSVPSGGLTSFGISLEVPASSSTPYEGVLTIIDSDSVYLPTSKTVKIGRDVGAVYDIDTLIL